ncbi:MAG: hypothetical protein M0Z95_05805 [Actinomycetota bacterium]|nr:hypothetical protein [Actinomycetota bacterium]
MSTTVWHPNGKCGGCLRGRDMGAVLARTDTAMAVAMARRGGHGYRGRRAGSDLAARPGGEAVTDPMLDAPRAAARRRAPPPPGAAWCRPAGPRLPTA